jgi:hypothetical protein
MILGVVIAYGTHSHSTIKTKSDRTSDNYILRDACTGAIASPKERGIAAHPTLNRY